MLTFGYTPPEFEKDDPPAVRLPMKILLVDDSPDNLFSVRTVLEPLGEELILANSGKEALGFCLDHDFAVILLDVRMPEMEGFETAESIRACHRSKDTPLLFLTGCRGDERLFPGHDLSPVDYLFRPVVPEILQSKVRALVELSRSAGLLRRQAETLAKAEQGFRSALEAAPDAMIVTRQDGTIVMADSRTAALFGFSGRERAAETAVNGAGRTPDSTARLRGVPSSGSDFPIETTSSPLYADDDVLVTSAIRDVSERVRAEESIQRLNADLERRVEERTAELVRSNDALRRSEDQLRLALDAAKRAEQEVRQLNRGLEERIRDCTVLLETANRELEAFADSAGRLASIVESSEDAIVGETLEGIITSWNAGAERIFGYTKDEAIGHSVTILAPPEGHDEVSQILDRIRRGERVRHFEATRRRKDGQRMVLSETISPIQDAAGRIAAVSMIARDITERQASEMEIRQFNEALQQKAHTLGEDIEGFSYSVSHDLRAPLRYMDGFLELLKNHIGGGLDEKGRHYLDTAIESAREMGVLIDDLLRFSRTGRGDMRVTKVNLANLVKQVQQELATDFRGRKVVWTVEPLPEVAGDPALLRQVLVNLLGNAIKYTQPRAEAAIAIGCREEGGEWVFFVRDNGVGFDMRYGHKLFGVFQRLHGDEFEGTGIGLAIVRRVIARHGGRTWAEGVVDQGATFYFSLPGAGAAEASDTGSSGVSQTEIERSSHRGSA